MVSTNDIRSGQVIVVDDTLMLVLEQQHIKPGKGKAFVRTKLRNLDNSSIIDKTFRADEEVEPAFIDKVHFTYLYSSGDTYTFMNASDYTQVEVGNDFIGLSNYYIKENQEVIFKIYKGKPIDIELPSTVILLVTESEPGVKGDTVSSTTKKVKCETGLEVDVPLFININDKIKIETKTGTYITRA